MWAIYEVLNFLSAQVLSPLKRVFQTTILLFNNESLDDIIFDYVSSFFSFFLLRSSDMYLLLHPFPIEASISSRNFQHFSLRIWYVYMQAGGSGYPRVFWNILYIFLLLILVKLIIKFEGVSSSPTRFIFIFYFKSID